VFDIEEKVGELSFLCLGTEKGREVLVVFVLSFLFLSQFTIQTNSCRLLFALCEKPCMLTRGLDNLNLTRNSSNPVVATVRIFLIWSRCGHMWINFFIGAQMTFVVLLKATKYKLSVSIVINLVWFFIFVRSLWLKQMVSGWTLIPLIAFDLRTVLHLQGVNLFVLVPLLLVVINITCNLLEDLSFSWLVVRCVLILLW
jgi:hypothetical protein